MKHRIFVFLLCLLTAALPMAARAEIQAEQFPIDIPVDIPLEAEYADSPAAPAEAGEIIEIIPAQTPEHGHEPTAAPIEIPGYGYYRISGSAAGYEGASPDAPVHLYLEGGVVYVSDRRASSAGDRMRVHFLSGGEKCSTWVETRFLRSMNMDESLDFIAAHAGARCYGGNPSLPLDSIACSPAVRYSLEAPEDKIAVPAMFVDTARLELKAGETAQIRVEFSDGEAHDVRFSSDDPAVARVDDHGRVYAQAAGAACIRLRSEFSNEAAVEIQVFEE